MQFELSAFETELEKMPFTRQARQIEAERHQADPMYAILTGQDARPIMECAFRYAFKKYSPDMERCALICEALSYLRSAAADHDIIVFNLLCIMHFERPVRMCIRDAIDVLHPGNLWGEQVHEHFDEFCAWLDTSIQNILSFPYNEENVVDMVVRSFVQAARSKYILND